MPPVRYKQQKHKDNKNNLMKNTIQLEFYEAPRTEVLEVHFQCLNSASPALEDYDRQNEQDW